jgi:hypothetical protein
MASKPHDESIFSGLLFDLFYMAPLPELQHFFFSVASLDDFDHSQQDGKRFKGVQVRGAWISLLSIT